MSVKDRHFYFLLFFCVFCRESMIGVLAQDTTKSNPFKIGAYADFYFGYAGGVNSGERVPYFVSSANNLQPSLNLAFVEFEYSSKYFRGRFVPGIGSYMTANYASEPVALRYILEGYIGVSPYPKKNVWIDAGIFSSPYTNETPVSWDHLMYTRSLAPEYVPYYIFGVRASAAVHKKLNVYLYVLNGWQQIVDQNSGKSVSVQLEFKPAPRHTISWNFYAGDERKKAKPYDRMRYYTDLYWIFQSGKRWSATSCVYLGVQQKSGPDKNVLWWQANLIGQYRIHPKLSISGRIEYFSDPSSAVATPLFGQPSISMFSGGICLNYKPLPFTLLRLEFRQFASPYRLYGASWSHSSNRMNWLTASTCIRIP